MSKKQHNQQYIVNVTKQLIGSRILAGITADTRAADPQALYQLLLPRLRAKVLVMRPETLGLICNFGYTIDFSEPIGETTGFIRLTGIEEVCPGGFDSKLSGWELLMEIAIRTIVSVACDIANQSDYQVRREKEREQKNLFDRGMREYLRYGPTGRLINEIKIPIASRTELREAGIE
jgi:hypothetical protein